MGLAYGPCKRIHCRIRRTARLAHIEQLMAVRDSRIGGRRGIPLSNRAHGKNVLGRLEASVNVDDSVMLVGIGSEKSLRLLDVARM